MIVMIVSTLRYKGAVFLWQQKLANQHENELNSHKYIYIYLNQLFQKFPGSKIFRLVTGNA